MHLLDANVFIEAKNRYYGFDFCPAFWDWLDVAHSERAVASVERVGDELAGGRDDLTEWAAARPGFFLEPDEAVVASLRAVSEWITGAGYRAGAVATFLQGADPYLIAHAHAHGHTVVTHEVVNNSLRRIKIPEVCIGLGVKHTQPFQMLRARGARFVLPDAQPVDRLF